MSSRPVCKRCLLYTSSSQPELVLAIEAHITAIPKEEKVSERELTRRLNCCDNCEHLVEIFCSLCGCYSPLRAAKKRMSCPDVKNKRW